MNSKIPVGYLLELILKNINLIQRGYAGWGTLLEQNNMTPIQTIVLAHCHGRLMKKKTLPMSLQK